MRFDGMLKIALAATIILGAVQLQLTRPLLTPGVSSGIVSLEEACTPEQARCIVVEWDAAGRGVLESARRSVWCDFAFILAYATLLACGCLQSGRVLAASWNQLAFAALGPVFAALAGIAGLCDAFENVGLLRELSGDFDWAPRACWAAFVKFRLIGLCAAFWFARPLGAMIRYATTHVALVLVLVLVYGFVFGLVGTGNGIPSLFWNDEPWSRFFAGLGGTLLLLELGVIVYYEQRDEAGGLVAVMAGPPPWPLPPAVVPRAQNLRYLRRFLGHGGWGFLLLLAAPAVLPRSFPNLPPHLETPSPAAAVLDPWAWPWLLGILMGAALTAALLTGLSRLIPGGNVANPGPSVRTLFLIFVVVYVVLAWPLYDHISPAFAICALLGVLTLLYALLAYFSDLVLPALAGGWVKSRVILVGLLVILVVWANNDPYKHQFPNLHDYYPEGRPAPGAVATQASPPSPSERPVRLRPLVEALYFVPEPPPLPPGGVTLVDDRAALSAWRGVLTRREEKVKPKLAVVVVSGGAMRSAYWTATVLERLEAEIPGFSRHVRVIAGASGGMVGAAFYVEELRRRAADAGHAPRPFPAILPRKSLDPVARYIACRELWHALLPVRWASDRGVALEQDWRDLRQPFAKYREFEGQGRIPSLIVSPMMVDDGRRLLISNLDLWDLTRTLGSMITEHYAGTDQHIYSLSAIEFFRVFPGATGFELATAVRMNASFPYVSPAVNLPTDPPRRVVDAGYYDNFGVQVASAWIEKNLPWLLAETSGVVLVQIRDAISQIERVEVRDAPRGYFADLGRSFQFFTSPVEGAEQARYTVSAFRNDQDVQSLSDLFTDRRARGLVEDGKDEAKVEEEKVATRSFFTTVVFENSAMVTDAPRGPAAWPGDSIAGVPAANDVALDWYLSEAERAGLDTAIPRPVDPATVERPPSRPPCELRPEPKPAPGSDWRDRGKRLARIKWLLDRVNEAHDTERALWLKALEQARNYEKLVRLKTWWTISHP